MNYLELIAAEIQRIAEPDSSPPDDYISLFCQYAVLALAKGEAVTSEDVHDAWVVWAIEHDPGNRNILPFKELSLSVQREDEPYAEAIREAARKLQLSD
ncbi:MAG: hypothetical protein KC435_06115 [Thermomicrobiales bacterium]|nr:hypothetical protein [Thermomicrobiales bacterium]